MGQILISITQPEFENIIQNSVLEAIKNNVPDPQPSNKEELLTRHETADFLGVSLPTLHDWTKTRKLKGYRIGNRVRYKKSDILQALNEIGNFKGKGV